MKKTLHFLAHITNRYIPVAKNDFFAITKYNWTLPFMISFLLILVVVGENCPFCSPPHDRTHVLQLFAFSLSTPSGSTMRSTSCAEYNIEQKGGVFSRPYSYGTSSSKLSVLYSPSKNKLLVLCSLSWFIQPLRYFLSRKHWNDKVWRISFGWKGNKCGNR